MRVRSLLGTAVLLVLGAVPAVAEPTATTYHLDCAAGSDAAAGTGETTAWRTLAKVSATTFGPGDRILIKRGTTCAGSLAPQGSGAAGSPITVDAYGSGAKPLIAGGGVPKAVRLVNQQHWEIRNLEITNTGATVAMRRGVSVELTDFGAASHIVLENLDIHHVNGEDKKDLGGSGGIYLAIGGNTVRTWFDDLTIRNNTVRSVDRAGIFMVSTWNRSGFETGSAGEFIPWPRVVISGNRLEDLGGDGIVAGNTTGALIERNYVNGFQKRSAGYNAGMWTYDSDNAVFQFNEATGGQTTRDGMGYDVDQGTIGTVFQYNYSHDNAGGFMLLCNATGILRGAIVRYNLSQNDSHRGVENCGGLIESAEVYNNTIYIGPGISQSVIQENNTTRRTVVFRNNIVVKSGSGTASMTLRSGGYTLDHNDLVNVSGAPAGAGITSDPRLSAAGTATDQAHADGYRLCAGSPALGAGAVVAGNGGRDYFGTALSGTPNIGAYGGAAVECGLLSNGGFESGLTDWSSRNASVTTTNPHSGTQAAALAAPAGSFATVERLVTGLGPNTAYTYSGWVRTSGVATNLGVKGFGGSEVFATTSATGWTQLSQSFTTSATATSATVYCYLPTAGSAACDDLTVTPASTIGGTHEIARAGTTQVVDVPGGSTGTGTQLIIWTRHGGANQQWVFTRDAAGEYAVKNVKSGLCIDIEGNSTTAGARVIQWTCGTGDNQKWRLTPVAGAYRITSKSSGLTLTAAGTPDGSVLTQQADTGSATQRWSLS
ncbi:RICIN domain-containing protein [Actinokineospora sp.]|uniref:RICIN domain-containing protein n=1 Tax=Actinokineospora sp. TaxID=1872133 RepID=UPI003D6B588E